MIKKFKQLLNEGFFDRKPKRRVSTDDQILNYKLRDSRMEKKYPIKVITSYSPNPEEAILSLNITRNSYNIGGELITYPSLRLEIKNTKIFIIIDFFRETPPTDRKIRAFFNIYKVSGVMLDISEADRVIETLREALDHIGAGYEGYEAINSGKLESILISEEEYKGDI